MAKAQIHMMESAMVVLVIFLLIAFGLIFFIGQQQATAREKLAEYNNINMMKKTEVLGFLPELQCTFDGVVDGNCYDLIKLMHFSEIYSANDFYYRSLIGNLKITIMQFDPSPGQNRYVRVIELYDYNKSVDKGYKHMSFPIQLYNASINAYYFGIINISIYQ
jgi:hypothetical protein